MWNDSMAPILTPLFKSCLVATLFVGCSDSSSDDDKDIPLPTLVISEVCPSPGIGPAAEFIEIQNIGEGPTELSEVKVSGAISYEFPKNLEPLEAGKTAVLVADANAFALAYPGKEIYGTYEGNLSRKGEEVKLEAKNGKDIFEAKYDNDPEWPIAAAYFGHCYQLKAGASGQWPADWKASASIGGTPGELSDAALSPKLRIEEILPPTDSTGYFLEFKNLSEENLNLQNYHLGFDTDSLQSLPEFAIAAGARALFPLDSLPSLSLSNQRIDLYLFNPSSRDAQKVELPYLEKGQSFSLFTKGLWAISTPTPNAENSIAKPGPLLLTEIHPNPSANGMEFLELKLTGEEDLLLKDSLTNWKVEFKGINVDLPQGALLKAGEHLLLVREEDGLASNVQDSLGLGSGLVLNYSGKLSNTGEEIWVEVPTEQYTTASGEIKWATVRSDRVSYLNGEGWPLAEELDGKSLLRNSESSWAIEADEWTLNSPTPGK